MNVAGKQKYMAQNADKLSKLISYVIANPQAFATIPGLAKSFNQLLEESGMSAIDFSQIVTGNQQAIDRAKAIPSPLGQEEIKSEQPLTQ